MAPNEEDEETLNLQASHGLGIGLGLGFLFIIQSQNLKPLSAAIKLADSAFKIPKTLQILNSPTPQTLILVSKALIKGFNASKRFIPLKPQPPNPTITSTRLKACIGAINLIRLDKFLGLGFLCCGHKISKNFVRVIEGFGGIQLDAAVKHAIDVLGLAIKASAVVREVRKLRRRRRKKNVIGFGRTVHWKSGICLLRRRLDFVGVCEFDFQERGMVCAEDMEVSLLSDLLCLSIPINQVTTTMYILDTVF